MIHPNHSFGILRGAFLLASGLVMTAISGRALDASEWKSRQTLAVDRTGVIKLALPPATLDLARPGLEDLRLLDPDGRETPFVIEHPAPAQPAPTRAPKSVRTNLTGAATQLVIETGSDSTPLDAITLVTPAPGFIKSARVEVSADGQVWETIRTGALVFRQFGAEQLSVALEGRKTAHLRVTLDDTRSGPIPLTGAILRLSAIEQPAATGPLPVRLLRRDEFAGETVLTLDLGAQNVPLATVEFSTTEPLFARRVTLSVRELRDDAMVERTLATGAIWRIAAEGLPPGAQLEVPVDFRAPSRELFVHLDNGDSPPIAIEEVRLRQHPVWLVFLAAGPGPYTLLSGNNQVAAPRYDLAALEPALRETQPVTVAPGPAATNPDYRRPDALADAPLLGAALDPAPWNYRKPVGVPIAGVQQLELDPDVLAHAVPGLGDLRLVRAGAQVPYLMEHAPVSRLFPVPFVVAGDPKRPSLSRWELTLPHATLPLSRVMLRSSTPLFQRHLRLGEKVTDDRGGTYERVLAEADWSHTPGHDAGLILNFSAVPATDRLWLETDNGDNPPLVLGAVQAAYPVTRLLFKAEPGPLALYYGNKEASAPRYDLNLVARQILTAEKSISTLGLEEKARGDAWAAGLVAGARGGPLLWISLALVVVVLLVVVARLLPKPTPPGQT